MRKEFQIALGKLINEEYGSNWDLPQVEKKEGGFEAKLVVFNQPKEKINIDLISGEYLFKYFPEN